MRRSARVTTEPRTRTAVLDLRQSTPPHVRTPQESLRLPSARQPRARTRGWRPAASAISDADVGRSATAAQPRAGCPAWLTQGTLGQVGLIRSSEVTRLSRHGSEGYPRLEICGYRRGVMADRDGVSAPATPHGRVGLGRTGQSSERARQSLRARLTAGLRTTAPRGALALPRPVGLCREALPRVQQAPDLAVQPRLDVRGTTVLPRHAARPVLRCFPAQAVTLPRRDVPGALGWKPPPVSAILATLQHPAAAGACVEGRTTPVRPAASPPPTSPTRVPIPAWTIRVPETYPASIRGEPCAKIQAMRQDT